MKPTRTWVLIADGARARILQSNGPGHPLQAIERLVFAGDHAATHDLVTDRQGRSFSSHGPGRSAIEPHSDPHRKLKTDFANTLANILAQELADRSYDRLVVVASPIMLGDLRAAFLDPVRKRIMGEVAQDLTKLPNSEVAQHLEHVLAI
jgi:protein required for attachment to host cells